MRPWPDRGRRGRCRAQRRSLGAAQEPRDQPQQRRVQPQHHRGGRGGHHEGREQEQRVGLPAADRLGVEDRAAAVELPEEQRGQRDQCEVEVVAAEPASLGGPRLLALRVGDRAPHGSEGREQHRRERQRRSAGGEQERVLAHRGGERLAAGDARERRRVAERADREPREHGAEQRGRYGDEQPLGQVQPQQLRGAGATAAVDRDLVGLSPPRQGRDHDDVERHDARHLQQQQQERHLRERARVAEPRQRRGELDTSPGLELQRVAHVARPGREVVECPRHVADREAVKVRDQADRVAGEELGHLRRQRAVEVRAGREQRDRLRAIVGLAGPAGCEVAILEDLPAQVVRVGGADEPDDLRLDARAHEGGRPAPDLLGGDVLVLRAGHAAAVVERPGREPHDVAEPRDAHERLGREEFSGRRPRSGRRPATTVTCSSYPPRWMRRARQGSRPGSLVKPSVSGSVRCSTSTSSPSHPTRASVTASNARAWASCTGSASRRRSTSRYGTRRSGSSSSRSRRKRRPTSDMASA